MVRSLASCALLVGSAASPTAAQAETPYNICMNLAFVRYSELLQPCYAIRSDTAENINKKARCQEQARADYFQLTWECEQLYPTS